MKQFWLWDLPATREQRSLAILFLRLFVGFMMLPHGFMKLADFEMLSTTFLNPIGIGPLPSLVLVIFAEVVCSFLIILGLFTRFAALVLTINMGVAVFIFHINQPFAASELALMYFAIYIVLIVLGGGRHSLDWFIFSSKSNPNACDCQNMTNFDRIIRLYIALVIWFFILTNLVYGVFALILLIISIPLLITSFSGYCCFYRILKKNKNSKNNDINIE